MGELRLNCLPKVTQLEFEPALLRSNPVFNPKPGEGRSGWVKEVWGGPEVHPTWSAGVRLSQVLLGE